MTLTAIRARERYAVQSRILGVGWRSRATALALSRNPTQRALDSSYKTVNDVAGHQAIYSSRQGIRRLNS